MTFTTPHQSYSYFLTEAQDLLQTLEQGIIGLRSNRTTAQVHELMRSAHTLKGAAASVGLSTISNVSHILEDIFRAFYNPEVVIDAEVEGLLFQGYECLRLLLTAQLNQAQVDETTILNRAADIIAQLQTKLGDRFDRDSPMPTSTELGFDMVQSMFEIGVTQRIEELSQALDNDAADLFTLLQTNAEIFLGLAESLELPGFAAIAQLTLAALKHHPNHVREIAQVALSDFVQGRAAVFAGDRTQGGSPSPLLQQWAGSVPPSLGTSATSSAASAASVLPTNQPIFFRSESIHASAGEAFTAPQSGSPLLKSLLAFLNTEIQVGQWLSSLKNWAATRVAPPLPSVDIFTPTATLPMTAAPFSSTVDPGTIPAPTFPGDQFSSPDLALEDLFGNLEPPPISPNPVSSNDSNPQNGMNPQVQTEVSVAEVSVAVTEPFPSGVDLGMKQESVWKTSAQEAPPPFPSTVVKARQEGIPKSTTVRVDLGKLEQLNHLVSELLIQHNQHSSQNEHLKLMRQELLEQLQKHRQTINDLFNESDRQLLNNRLQTPEKSVPGDAFPLSLVQHFDDLEMDRYSEVHILARTALNEMIELDAIAETLNEHTRQQHHVLDSQQRLLFLVGRDLTAIRMQPLEDLFNRLAQVIQQLATSHQKPVEVVLHGMEVLVDKTIVEKLYDPLLHLVRNAFDHGIELAEIRRTTGKATVGQIEITAFHQGNRTIIEVKDDGPGIDLQRVAQRAIELGLLPPEEAKTVTENRLLSFLFESGFSTAAQVNDLSGRGVGLDVVRNRIQEFNGSISVAFSPQRGTTFSLQIPISLTIAKLVVCQDQGIVYALPLDAIVQVIPQPDQLQQVGNHQVMQWEQGDELTSVVVQRFSDLLEYSEVAAEFKSPTEPMQSSRIILLRTATGLVGLQVEQVFGEQELVIRPFTTAIAPPPYVYGCCIIGNNQQALVLDVKLLLQQRPEMNFTSNQDTFLAASSDAPSTPAPQLDRTSPFHILLVEDSLTLRRTLSQLLQQAGYRVSEAKDGLEALALLQKQPDVDLIICDIEMPRMNGFEFLSQRQQHSAIATIPVVMLTSRSTEKYRLFALKLGASHFMTKPYADRELLSTVKDLVMQP
jgi:chemotaxis family two-component system sensor histidine kinase/response regulator PixL